MRRALPIIAVILLASSAARAQDASAPPVDPAHIRALMREVEELRGASFTADVAVERESADDFRAYVVRELDRTLSPAEADSRSKAQQALGLLPRGFDLRRALVDLYVSQAGAHYDPVRKRCFLVSSGLPADEEDGALFHELVHALQDQRFKLDAIVEKARLSGNDDVEAASSFAIEGEATYLMFARQLAQASGGAAPTGPEAEAIFARIRDTDRAAVIRNAQALQGRLGEDGAALGRALDALSAVPDSLFWTLHAPYLRGQWLVHRARAAKGWAAVDALLARPLGSTEQALHPEKALAAGRDAPVDVALPALDAAMGKGFRLVRRNTLGEAGTLTLLVQFAPATGAAVKPADAAAGWGGDRYEVDEGPDGALALVWRTAWDTEKDATEFATAARAWTRPALGKLEVEQKGKVVTIIDVPKEAFEAVKRAIKK